MYSPAATHPEQIPELERHDCPELFMLVEGNLSLLVSRDGKVEVLPLVLHQPVLVSAPHSGFCPDGPHTGRAFVVERDAFDTEYRPVDKW